MEPLRHAMRTGEPFVGRELTVALDRDGSGVLEETHFDLVHQPLRDAQGAVTWLLTHAVEVTEQVRARRLLEESEQALRESEGRFRLMAEAGERLSSLDERELPGRFLELLVPRLADRAWVELLSEAGLFERVAQAPGTPEREGFMAGLSAGMGQVLRTGRSFVQPAGPGREESVLVLPLLAQARVVGMLGLVREAPGRPFKQEDLQLCEELTRRAGLAVDNARLYRAARGRAEHMRLLSDSFQLFTQYRGEMGPSLRAVVELVSESFGDSCSMVLLDAETGGLELAAAHHPDPAVLALLQKTVGPLSIPEDGFVPTVLRTGKPLRLANMPQALPPAGEERVHARLYIERVGMHSILIVPLRAPEGLIGSLSLSRSRPDFPYSLEDQNLLQELADRAGLVVSNARLRERLKARR